MSFHFLSLIFGIRTFQGVTADSNKKKLFPGPAPSRRLHPSSTLAPKSSKRLGGHWEINSTGLGFSQHNVAGSLPPE